MPVAPEFTPSRAARILLVLIPILLLVGAGFGMRHLLPRLEDMAADFRAKIAPGPDVSPDIVHVDIDDNTIRELGKWPFSRTAHARVLDVLTALDAKIIAYDVVFHGQGDPEEDAALEHALARNGKVILGAAFQLAREPQVIELSLDPDDLPLKRSAPDFQNIDIPALYQAERSFMPLARFAEHALGTAHISAHRDPDGVVREVPLLIGFNGFQVGAMSLEVAMHASGLTPGAFSKAPFLPGTLRLDGTERTVPVPVDEACLMQVNYAAPWKKSFPHVPFHVIHNAAGNPKELERLVPLIQGKCVLIGQAASGSTDLGPTPMGTAQPQIAVHAAALNTLLTQSFIRSSPWFTLPAALFLCLSVLVLRQRLSHGRFMAAAPALIPLWAGINWGLYAFFGLAVNIVSPMIGAGVVFITVLVLDYTRAMKEIMQRRKERQILEIQLEAAARIQSHFLPEPPNPGHGSSVWATCVPATYVGGDFYDVIPLPNDRFLIYLADVSGKGLPASLIMAAAWSRIRSEASLADTPEEILARVNRSLYSSLTGEGHFITALFGVYTPKTGTLRYVDAGHMAPVWCGREGLKEPPKIKSLPLGVVDDAVYSAAEITLEPGDSVIFMSDGVTEAADFARRFFGMERVLDVVRESRGNGKGPALLKAVRGWRGSTPPNDDTTLVELCRIDAY